MCIFKCEWEVEAPLWVTQGPDPCLCVCIQVYWFKLKKGHLTYVPKIDKYFQLHPL